MWKKTNIVYSQKHFDVSQKTRHCWHLFLYSNHEANHPEVHTMHAQPTTTKIVFYIKRSDLDLEYCKSLKNRWQKRTEPIWIESLGFYNFTRFWWKTVLKLKRRWPTTRQMNFLLSNSSFCMIDALWISPRHHFWASIHTTPLLEFLP